MKKTILLLIFILICKINYSQKILNDLVVKNTSIITMKNNKVLKNKDIIIKKGKIIDIIDTNSKKYDNDILVIDGKGKFIMPSLSDAHVHLPKEEKDLEKYLILNLINGVTKIRSMRGDWKHIKWKEKYNAENHYYPKMYLSPPPMHRSYEMNEDEINEYVMYSKEFDFIKILSIKDVKTFILLNKACKSNNIQLGGHYPTNIPDSLIFNSMYSSFEHLGGLTEPKSTDKIISKIKAKECYITPTLSWYDIGSGKYSYEQLRKRRGMKYIPNEKMENWIAKTKIYREKLGKEKHENEVLEEAKKINYKYEVIKKLKKEGVKMLLSPDCSAKYMIAGFGIIDEMNLLKNANLNNFEILEMCTVNFSDFFKENYGTIEKNKDADFLILNKNPLKDIMALDEIESIYFNNNLITKKDLKEMSKLVLRK